MHLKIHQTTRYTFDAPVRYGLQQLRTTPKTSFQQQVLRWETRIEGGKGELVFQDQFNNIVELVSFARDTTELAVISDGEVQIEDNAGILGLHRRDAPLWLFRRSTPLTRAKAGAKALARDVADGPDLDRLHALSRLIRSRIDYEVGVSHPGWTAEDAIEQGRGVCQDHTHVFLACARTLGYPARYVSGYLMLNDSIAQDAMHAWAEAHVDGLGWVGFDISNGISPDSRYVRVATGLDYGDAAPVSGLHFGGEGESLQVEIHVAQQ